MTSNDGSGDGGTAGRSGDGRDGGVGDRTPGVRPAGDGRVELTGDGQRLVLESDAELRFLYDRGFSWDEGDGAAVNR